MRECQKRGSLSDESVDLKIIFWRVERNAAVLVFAFTKINKVGFVGTGPDGSDLHRLWIVIRTVGEFTINLKTRRKNDRSIGYEFRQCGPELSCVFVCR